MPYIRVDTPVEVLAETLERTIGPTKQWLNDYISGDEWCIYPYSDYCKVWLSDDRMKSIVLLSL